MSIRTRFCISEASLNIRRAVVLVACIVALVDFFVLLLVLISALRLTTLLLMGTRFSVAIGDSRSMALLGRLGRLVNIVPLSSRLMHRWVFGHSDIRRSAFVILVLFS